jgi:hypothetical protein
MSPADPVLPVVASLPIILDVSAIPVKPTEPTPDTPFTHPKPCVMTGHRSLVRVIKARRKLVVLDSDLAVLYGTTVDAVNKAVMRNACCLPRSQCFRLSNDEWNHLQKNTNVGNVDRGNWLCAPLVFTDDGAVAVSNILDTFEATRGSVCVWRVIHDLRLVMAETTGRVTA